MGIEVMGKPGNRDFRRLPWTALAAMAAFLVGTTGVPLAAAADAETAPQERKDVFKQGLRELAAADAESARYPDSLPLHFNRLRILYVLGVKEERFLREGEQTQAWLESRAKDEASTQLLLAYRGALRVARAKHGFNLNRKWENLKAGIPLLDSAVAQSPRQPELRYLRLVSNYYLPFFLGRKGKVGEDFTALARLLPESAGDYPPKWFLNVAGFVLEKGKLKEEERQDLAVRVSEVSNQAKNETKP
ncbi:MAG: hypothetical protein ABIW76_21325 [Fibrobacteria bacterium]